MGPARLAEALLDALPQTQCTRCGYPDCRGYAEAMADASADINRCPPGGHEGIARLARLTARPVAPLDPACGSEGPRALAVIDEADCIGCALCLRACPVDAIVGASRHMHTVAEVLCTGCELCVPVCPVDCIRLVEASGGRTGWDAWGEAEASQARARYARHRSRLESPSPLAAANADAGSEATTPLAAAKSEILAAAVARARAARPGR